MICVPIKRVSISSILKDLKKVAKKADLVEVWFDEINESLTEEGLKKILRGSKIPILYKVTNGKNFEELIGKKIKYIDLDLKTNQQRVGKVKKHKCKLVLSFHDFEKTPSDKELEKIAKKMLLQSPDIIKIATTAKDFSDSLRMLQFLCKLNKKGIKAICLCMGKHGAITRAAGHLFGNYLMFAPLADTKKTAPGQITLDELKKIHNLIK